MAAAEDGLIRVYQHYPSLSSNALNPIQRVEANLLGLKPKPEAREQGAVLAPEELYPQVRGLVNPID